MEIGELPNELVCVPQQPVAVTGLHVAHHQTHKVVWDAFAANRRADRLPLRFKLVSADHEFPKAKPKVWGKSRGSRSDRYIYILTAVEPSLLPFSHFQRASYDSYAPRGVLKANWMRKHLEEVPTLVVLFMDLDWNHPSWVEKKTECQSKVESLRLITLLL